MIRSQYQHAVYAYYIELLQQESCQNLMMAAIGRNMQFSIANKPHHLPIYS